MIRELAKPLRRFPGPDPTPLLAGPLDSIQNGTSCHHNDQPIRPGHQDSDGVDASLESSKSRQNPRTRGPDG